MACRSCEARPGKATQILVNPRCQLSCIIDCMGCVPAPVLCPTRQLSLSIRYCGTFAMERDTWVQCRPGPEGDRSLLPVLLPGFPSLVRIFDHCFPRFRFLSRESRFATKIIKSGSIDNALGPSNGGIWNGVRCAKAGPTGKHTWFHHYYLHMGCWPTHMRRGLQVPGGAAHNWYPVQYPRKKNNTQKILSVRYKRSVVVKGASGVHSPKIVAVPYTCTYVL